MSFISCVNSGIRSSPLALGLLRWTAILAVHSELSISWPYCIVTVSARSALRSRRSPRCVWQDWAIDDALNILRWLLAFHHRIPTGVFEASHAQQGARELELVGLLRLPE